MALSMVALLAFVGLAIDGGLEAVHFRVAQNGADAGALAAARQVYETNSMATSGTLCDSAGGVAPNEIRRNTVVDDACRARSLTSYVAASPSGFQSYGAAATVDENLNVNVLLSVASLATHVGLNEATAATTGSPSQRASGNVDLVGLNATLTSLGLPTSASATLFGCGTSQPTPGTSTAPAGGTCPQSSLALSLLGAVDVTGAIGLTNPVPGLLQQSSQSTVPPATSMSQQPQERDSSKVLNDHLTLTGVADLTTSVATTTLRQGSLGGTGNPSGVQATSEAVHVGGTVAGLALSADGIKVGARISWDPRNGFTSATTCTSSNVAINGTELLAGITIGDLTRVHTGCDIGLVNLGGLLTVKSDNTTDCQQGALGMVCTADVCFLDITLLSVPGINSASVCIGKAHASATFQPVTRVAAVTVSGHVPTQTYFIRVLGWNQTNPAATASAMPQQVLDETSGWFSAAPYAVSNVAPEYATADQAAYCSPGTWGPLQPGCGYRLWGVNVPDNGEGNSSACTAAPSPHCWHGQLASTSPHAVGTSVSPVSGDGGGPVGNVGSRYVLLPVIGGAGSALQVAYYGLFKLDTVNTGCACGTLVRVPDVTNNVVAAAVQSTSDIGWNPDVEGAVSVKLVDTSTLDRLGYS